MEFWARLFRLVMGRLPWCKRWCRQGLVTHSNILKVLILVARLVTRLLYDRRCICLAAPAPVQVPIQSPFSALNLSHASLSVLNTVPAIILTSVLASCGS